MTQYINQLLERRKALTSQMSHLDALIEAAVRDMLEQRQEDEEGVAPANAAPPIAAQVDDGYPLNGTNRAKILFIVAQHNNYEGIIRADIREEIHRRHTAAGGIWDNPAIDQSVQAMIGDGTLRADRTTVPYRIFLP